MPTADQVMKQLRNDCTDEELGTMKFSVQRLLAAIDRAKKANKPARIFEVANELKG